MNTVISLCDKTGVMVQPWAMAGYPCMCLDLQHSIRQNKREGNIIYRWADVRSLTPYDLPDPLIIFAAPPCTHLAGSGARDWQAKRVRLWIDALKLVDACWQLCHWYSVPWMLENPVGRLSQVLGKASATFQPWQYGELYQKRTCIWSGNGFVMPPPTVTTKPTTCKQAIWAMPPSPERADRRSITPRGFARAVFEANWNGVNLRTGK